MKRFYFLIILISLSFSLEAQVQKKSKEEIENEKMEASINKEADKLRKRLEKQLKTGEISSQYELDAEVEMYKIDDFIRRNLEKDNSSSEYIAQLIIAETKYNRLLRQFVRVLASKLEKEEQDLLLTSQNQWNNWLETERKFNSSINDPAYLKDEINFEVAAEHYLQMTKNRFFHIMDYLARIEK